MDEKWFWAWRALKNGERDNAPREDVDEQLLDGLVTQLMADTLPRGDGKFSRLDNYIKTIRAEISLVKKNWSGNAEILSAFLLGLDVTFEVIQRTAEKIKKGR